jgi:mono/diheme cytochrome c family protein
MRRFLLACLVLVAAPPAIGQARDASRGRLLYDNHCIECHTEQMHWRTLGTARDWDTLKAQVRRWQGEARLQWSEDDIDAVARHLNDTIYGFPRPVAGWSRKPSRVAPD